MLKLLTCRIKRSSENVRIILRSKYFRKTLSGAIYWKLRSDSTVILYRRDYINKFLFYMTGGCWGHLLTYSLWVTGINSRTG